MGIDLISGIIPEFARRNWVKIEEKTPTMAANIWTYYVAVHHAVQAGTYD
jgi:hypothetical protein